MDDIPALMDEKFVRTGRGYVPKDPGRHEYRQCGIKQDGLVLQLEEALLVIELPGDVLNEYARHNGYAYFLVYQKIREMGWILLPYPGHRYTYYLHRPNKHFNRKTAECDRLLQIVSPEAVAGPAVFQQLGQRRIVFAVAEGSSFVLLEGAAAGSPAELLGNYAPVARR